MQERQKYGREFKQSGVELAQTSGKTTAELERVLGSSKRLLKASEGAGEGARGVFGAAAVLLLVLFHVAVVAGPAAAALAHAITIAPASASVVRKASRSAYAVAGVTV